MSLEFAAKQTVVNHVMETQLQLDMAAASARMISQVRIKELAVDGIPIDSRQRPIAEFLADGIIVGRESDGYPAVCITSEARDVMRGAVNAELFRMVDRFVQVGSLSFYHDFSGLNTNRNIDFLSDDYKAWNAAREYRAKNSK